MTRTALIVTVVHHPQDARIRYRQIPALLEAGWRVRYAAPFTGYGLDPQQAAEPGLTPIDLPRAAGRRRLGAVRAARGLLRRERDHVDVALVHDPDLLLATARLPRLTGDASAHLAPVVWDVHEDTAAAVAVRSWIPGPIRRPVAAAVRFTERWAERRMPLLLADAQYADRFAGGHPVVPNTTAVPATPARAAVPEPDGRYRVVYLGSITIERGAREIVELGRRLGDRVLVEVIGPAHGQAQQILTDAAAEGLVRWHGQIPNDRALAMLDGALAGLSLLHDIANFRPSMATKVVEYLAHGVPAITTALPIPADLVRRSGGGVVVPFAGSSADVDAVEAAITALLQDPDRAASMGAAGHAVARAEYDWQSAAADFVQTLDRIATAQSRP